MLESKPIGRRRAQHCRGGIDTAECLQGRVISGLLQESQKRRNVAQNIAACFGGSPGIRAAGEARHHLQKVNPVPEILSYHTAKQFGIVLLPSAGYRAKRIRHRANPGAGVLRME